ncbi:MAG: LLM class flavin-dependent oxidoreductase [Halobacteriaceae archaeon]
MKLGYSITSFQSRSIAPQEAVNAILNRAETAASLGYDYIEAGDHHVVSDGQYFQNVPMTARLTQYFDHVATMWLLPLYNPVHVAESGGTLDALSSDFDAWFAIGGGENTFNAFDIPLEQRVPRLKEGLEIITRLWEENNISFQGDFYSLDNVSVNPKASPRICIGGGVKAAVRRAAQLGDAWVAGPGESKADLRRKSAWFSDAGGGDLIVRREVLGLADAERAQEKANAKLTNGYRGWPTDAEWVIAGDANTIANELETLWDIGVDEVVIRPMSNSHAIETLKESYRGFSSLKS